MEPHALSTYTAKLIEQHGIPQVLDVDNSIEVFKPMLTGAESPASYYIRPPTGMTADALIGWFEDIPGFREFKLTLVPIFGLDTFHQPLISTDDFAKKYFHDNQLRIVRVTGKSNHAIEAMHAFVEALKRPFDASLFPHHEDFSVSGYRAAESGRATELKLLYKPADHNNLMRVERLVIVHLYECNLGREIGVSRHATRSQAPELILISTSETPTGVVFLEALANSLPHATHEEVVEVTETAQRSSGHAVAETSSLLARFAPVKPPSITLPPDELKKRALASLAEVMKVGRFADGAEVSILQRGSVIEVEFPRTLSSLWLATSFKEKVHIKEVAKACVGVRTDPQLREGWSVVYNFDSKTGKLHIRAVDAGSEPPTDWKAVSR
ncbi:MAG: hypothetical protein P4L46_06060 [Fimbriimonas sp.]|nr:hypothetical protein [Fimbriimonas sp.]